MDSRPREAPAPAEPSGGAAPAAANGEVEITKPRNDKRGYRRVVLPNALECLIISDPDTDKVFLLRSLLRSGWAAGVWYLSGFLA